MRAAVAADVQSRLPAGVAADKVGPETAAIYRKHQASGLHSLQVKPVKGEIGAYEVLVRASALAPIGPRIVVGPPDDQFTTEDVKQLFLRSGYTTAIGSLNISLPAVPFDIRTPLGKTQSKSGGTKKYKIDMGSFRSAGASTHAEVALLTAFEASHQKVLPRPDLQHRLAGGSAELQLPPPNALMTITVTRSPCPNCAARIAQTKSFGQGIPYGDQKWGFDIKVRALGPYSPTKSPFAGMLGRIVGLIGLLRLRRAGVAVEPLDLNDPTMACVNLPPSEMKNLETRGRKLKDYIDNLRKLIFKYGRR